MSDWATGRQLAAAKLPGIPGSKEGVRLYAAAHSWTYRDVKTRGGTSREYSLDHLTVEQRERWLDHLSKALPAAARGAVTATSNRPDVGAMPGGEASDGAAAGAILIAPTRAEIAEVIENRRGGMWEAFERATSRKQKAARDRLARVLFVADLIETGGHNKETARAAAIAKFGGADATLRGWLARVKNVRRADWLASLIDGYCGRAREANYDTRFWEFFKSDYLRTDRPPAMACWRRAVAFAHAQNIADPLPRCITLMRRLRAEVPWQSIKFAREGATALHRTYPAQRRDRSVFHALEAVNGDGYRFNVAVIWPDGELRRPVLWSWQDVYSGKILAWRLDKTENASLLRLSIGDLIREQGIPDIFVIDNTPAASSKWITGGMPGRFRFRIRPSDPLGLITLLGSRRIATIPVLGGPSKPVERAQGDFDRDISRHPALAGAWLGTNPMTRPEAAREPVALEKFLAVMREGILDHNARPGRRSAVCNGRSFDETYAESYARSVVKKPTPEQLRLCMLAAENINVAKRDGTIELFGNLYYSGTTAALAGSRVVVRFDPESLHKSIFVYAADGRFIGEAECRAAVGFADAAAAREHNRLRRQNLKGFKAIARNERTMSALQLAAALPVSPDPEPLSSKVVSMFRPRIAPPVAAAAASIGDADEYLDPLLDEGELRFREYLRLQALAPESLTEADRRSIRVFEGASDFRARQMFGVIAS